MPKREEVRERMLERVEALWATESVTMGEMARVRSWVVIVS